MTAVVTALICVVLSAPWTVAADEAEYVGVKRCIQCHENHLEAWSETAHAKSFESLRPGIKAEAKTKAKLDPSKDYTEDKVCLSCHTTGFDKPGGYEIGDSPGGSEKLGSIGCESCHGAGELYRKEHSKAESKLKKEAESTNRKVLVQAGQNFDFAQACARCHLNYKGSPWEGAKAPFTPFTPRVDATKYAFDFDTAIRSAANHKHFKLYGVFKGPPTPPFRDEFQETAEEIE